jgi:O-antigen/teichoic acid export membrane protein
LTSPVSTLLIPALAKLRRDPPQARRLVIELVGLSALLSAPAFAGLAAVAPDLTAALLGPAYAGAGAPLAVLALSQLWTPLGYFVDGVLSGIGRNFLRLLLSGLDTALVGLALWIFAAYGLTAAFWATFVQSGVVTVLALLVQRWVLKAPLRAYLGAAAPAYFAAGVMCLAVIGFRHAAAEWPALARLAGGVAVGAVVYAAVVAVLFRRWLRRAIDLLRGRGRFALQEPEAVESGGAPARG